MYGKRDPFFDATRNDAMKLEPEAPSQIPDILRRLENELRCYHYSNEVIPAERLLLTDKMRTLVAFMCREHGKTDLATAMKSGNAVIRERVDKKCMAGPMGSTADPVLEMNRKKVETCKRFAAEEISEMISEVKERGDGEALATYQALVKELDMDWEDK